MATGHANFSREVGCYLATSGPAEIHLLNSLYGAKPDISRCWRSSDRRSKRDLNQVTWEQRAMEGDPKFAVSQDLRDLPYARYAELIDFQGIRGDRPEDIADAWEMALNAQRPVLLEAITDPNVPPVPPPISLGQTMLYISAILKGDVDAVGVIKQSIKELPSAL